MDEEEKNRVLRSFEGVNDVNLVDEMLQFSLSVCLSEILIARDGKSDMSDISREIYQYIRYTGRNISLDNFFLNKHSASRTCNLVSYQIDIFYRLDSLSKLTQIITYFQTREHEKLITTFFTGYFPSPSVSHKNLRFCWKLLRIIIYSLELEKLIITFFREKNEKCEFVTTTM